MKFPYLIINEDYSVQGVTAEIDAREAAEWAIVIDVANGVSMGADATDDVQIQEFKPQIDPEDSTELPASLTPKD